MAKRTKDEFTRDWIIENSVEILSRYEPGVLTIRALHYQLVSIGMTNTLQHYKRVVGAMEVARWDGRVDFEAFSDRDRAMCGYTHAEPTNLEDKQDGSKTTGSGVDAFVWEKPLGKSTLLSRNPY